MLRASWALAGALKRKVVNALTIAFFADIIKPYKQGRGGYLYGIESAASGMPGGFFKYYEAVNGIV